MESKDPLKDFIDQNRDAFDKQHPSRDLWAAIDEQINPPKPKVVSIRTLWLVAASLLVLLGLPLTWMLLRENDVSQTNLPTAQIEVGNPVLKEFQEAETYYTAEINDRVNLIHQLNADEDLLREIEFLQEEYENLKREMESGADAQKIITAMIENYRLRLNLLEEILEELQDNTRIKNGGEYEAA